MCIRDRPGSVKLERLMEIERFSHVMHMTSRVTAQVNDGSVSYTHLCCFLSGAFLPLIVL